MMVRALLKKQLLESFSLLFKGRGGKEKKGGSATGTAVLMIVAFGVVGGMFFMVGKGLCLPLIEQGLEWLYFAFMGVFATAFGIIGSVFATKSQLYEAKDNDLLFSMPVPSWLVLFSRMVGLYAYTFFFEALVFLPAVLAFFTTATVTFSGVAIALLTLFIAPLGTLGVCCILGWLLALITAKLPLQKVFTLLLTLAFMAVYFLLYSKLNEILNYVLANGGALAAKTKAYLYPFYLLGVGCTGGWGEFALFALLFVGVFALVYLLLATTYLRLVTSNRGSRKQKYKGKSYRQNSSVGALLKKEFKRYFNNPMVVLNCMLGSIFLLIVAFLPLFMEELKILADKGADEWIALGITAAVCACASMNVISSSSVSLEGENLWILRSLPVKTEKIFLAKVLFHWTMTAIPAAISITMLCILLKVNVLFAVCAAVVSLLFIACDGALGLLLDVKHANLHWTNELVPIKQSVTTLLSMFVGLVLLIFLAVCYFLWGRLLFAGGFFLFTALLFGGGLAGLVVWLKKRGVKRFEELQ